MAAHGNEEDHLLNSLSIEEANVPTTLTSVSDCLLGLLPVNTKTQKLTYNTGRNAYCCTN